MEIGFPTNVRHVAHVTFDRFNGFLGLPVEFQPEVPSTAPSASTTVFGVSTNSMQLSFDSRGNSVPTILLMMQRRLYELGGLQAEGIFRINAENGQEEDVRDQLNRGLVPHDVDIHCLAGLIKAWFRELPTGILDSLSPEQVMQSQTEEECVGLSRLLPPTEGALLDWAINLMADVAQFEQVNKMNARNVAMVFAPNMTHMADPLTALMHAVQVMNFLKTLIERTIRERESSILDLSSLDSCDNDRDPSGGNSTTFSVGSTLKMSVSDNTPLNIIIEDEPDEPNDDHEKAGVVTSMDPAAGNHSSTNNDSNDHKEPTKESKASKGKLSQGSNKGCKMGDKKGQRVKTEGHVVVQKVCKSGEKTKGSRLVSSVNPRTDRIEAWR